MSKATKLKEAMKKGLEKVMAPTPKMTDMTPDFAKKIIKELKFLDSVYEKNSLCQRRYDLSFEQIEKIAGTEKHKKEAETAEELNLQEGSEEEHTRGIETAEELNLQEESGPQHNIYAEDINHNVLELYIKMSDKQKKLLVFIYDRMSKGKLVSNYYCSKALSQSKTTIKYNINVFKTKMFFDSVKVDRSVYKRQGTHFVFSDLGEELVLLIKQHFSEEENDLAVSQPLPKNNHNKEKPAVQKLFNLNKGVDLEKLNKIYDSLIFDDWPTNKPNKDVFTECTTWTDDELKDLQDLVDRLIYSYNKRKNTEKPIKSIEAVLRSNVLPSKYCAVEDDYISREEKILRKRIEEERKRVERVKKLKEEHRELKFELFKENLTPEDEKEIEKINIEETGGTETYSDKIKKNLRKAAIKKLFDLRNPTDD